LTKIKRNSQFSRINSEDKILINQIIRGCRILIKGIISRDPKKDAKAVRHTEPKSLATTSASIMSLDKGPLRASDIKKKLPENIQNIHPSMISRIISHNKRIGRLKTTNFKEVKKRGHPTEDSVDKVSGPKLYYGRSEFEKRIELLLSNRAILQRIYKKLEKENLIFELEKYSQLRIISIIRNNNGETAWKLLKSVFTVSEKESNFDDVYNAINAYNESDILSIAEQKAKSILKSRTAQDYLYVIKQGAYMSSNIL